MRIDVLDADTLARVGWVDVWVSLYWDSPYYSEGSFTLEVRPTTENLQLLQEGRWLVRSDESPRIPMRICSRANQNTDANLVVSGYPATWLLTKRVSAVSIKNQNAEAAMRSLVSAAKPWPRLELGTEYGFDTTELVITPERGGMITGFSLNGEEYIWTRHPNFSECNRPRFGVPVLFPNCGLPDNGVHIFDGKAYPMENHGFADLCAWDVESVGPDGVTLILESTPLTKFLYPFDFTVLMNYNLEGNTATINMTVINEGDTNMPFSFGFHPYFKASKLENVDFDIKCATCSESAKGEQPAAPEKITLTRKEGADNSVRLLTGVQFPMTLTDSGSGHKVTVDADDSFDHAVLWQQDAESFVCMEPWNGWANSVNEEGKHEVLEPDEAMTADWSITIEKV